MNMGGGAFSTLYSRDLSGEYYNLHELFFTAENKQIEISQKAFF